MPANVVSFTSENLKEIYKMDSFDELKKQKEEADKFMLRTETVLGYISSASFLAFILVASYIEMPALIRTILVILGSVIFAVGIGYAIKIEQIAGYYECGNCHHRYIPSYSSIFFSKHICRTRYMKCPECGEKSWNKKVLTK